ALRDALEDIAHGVLRMETAAHVLADDPRAAREDDRLAPSRRARSSRIVVDVEARADDRRIADAAGDLVREPARRRHSGKIAARVDREAVDRPLDPRLVARLRLLGRQPIVLVGKARFPLEP